MRSLRTLAAVATVAIGCALIVSILVTRGSAKNDPASPLYRGSKAPGPYVLPQFNLRSYQGDFVNSKDLRGKVVLLTLLDSHCTDVCPIIASVVARTIDELRPAERRQLRAIAITSNPTTDTPKTVRHFLAIRGAIGRLDYLLGTEKQLRPLWTALQILPSIDSGNHNIHSAPIRIYNRKSVWKATQHAGEDLNEANLLHDIRLVLSSGS